MRFNPKRESGPAKQSLFVQNISSHNTVGFSRIQFEIASIEEIMTVLNISVKTRSVVKITHVLDLCRFTQEEYGNKH